MSVVKQLRKNNGQFDYKDFVEHIYAYEKAFDYLIKRKEYQTAIAFLKCYMKQFEEISNPTASYYRPGMDYINSTYLFLKYAQFMEKGIKGVVRKNQKEATRAWLEILKRYFDLPRSISKIAFRKRVLLLKHAYPDILDQYSMALFSVGQTLYEKGQYEEAFKYFKKGADFDCDGRQISFPFYLIGKNQDMVANMYKEGKGVKLSLKLAKHYYQECANNCGRDRHPKMGDFLLGKKKYSEAFMCYTETNRYFLYNTSFMNADNLDEKFKIIKEGIDHILDNKKSELDKTVLAMMYKVGLGCEKDEKKYQALLPKDNDWADKWIDDYYHPFYLAL